MKVWVFHYCPPHPRASHRTSRFQHGGRLGDEDHGSQSWYATRVGVALSGGTHVCIETTRQLDTCRYANELTPLFFVVVNRECKVNNPFGSKGATEMEEMRAAALSAAKLVDKLRSGSTTAEGALPDAETKCRDTFKAWSQAVADCLRGWKGCLEVELADAADLLAMVAEERKRKRSEDAAAGL